MKVRHGFVSNSSTSSFVCSICNEIYAGQDASLSDFEMHRCERGHEFCDSHIASQPRFNRALVLELLGTTKNKIEGYTWISKTRKAKDIAKIQVDIDKLNAASNDDADDLAKTLAEEHEFDSRYECLSNFCPICNMNEISGNDLVAYLQKKSGMCKTATETQIKEEFIDYAAFKAFLKPPEKNEN